MNSIRQNRFYYGYIIVAAAFLMEVLNIGINNSFGLFIPTFQSEFGWSRALISGAATVSMLISSTLIVLWGLLCDKFGPRLILSIAGAVTGLGILLMSQVNSIWQLYLFWGIIGGIGIGAPDLIGLSLVARWFKSNVGIMSGIAKVGAGVGMLILPLMVNGLMSSFNWNFMFIFIGCIYLIAIVGAAQFTRLNPASIITENKKTDNILPPESGLNLRQALRTKQLWIAGIMNLAYLWGAQTVIIHVAPYAHDLGFPAERAALTISMLGAASIFGRLIIGWIADRLSNKTATTITLSIMCLALACFQIKQPDWIVFPLSALFGFSHGGYAALISPKVAEVFGIRAHGAVYGVVTLFGSIGVAVGPLMGGYLFDIQGNYNLVFIIVAFLIFAALLLNIALKRARW
jgi:MFS family permease